MPWDPFGVWPRERRWIWATLAVWIGLLQGPAFVENLRTWDEYLPDFFQEYASARNVREGLPVYTNHRITIPRYLGSRMDPERTLVVVNAHPPTSVLLALPFAGLNFEDAFLLWNLVSLVALAVSLGLVLRGLEIPFSAWSVFPLATLLLLCHPLWAQLQMGQLNLVLLLLLTGTWAAERSGWPWLAGVLLGAATAIKLFPGFLFFYYTRRRRWTLVGAGALALAALTGLTVVVLGPETYRAYIQDVLPEIHWFRVGWNNASLMGFWSRLFDPAPERERLRSRTEPLLYSPALARAGAWLSSALVVAVLAWVVRRVRARADEDLAFGLAVTAMLLISPIAWDHYFLLLLVPLTVVWLGLPPSRWAKLSLLAIVLTLWLNPAVLWTAFDLGGRVARPIHALTVLSCPMYALLGLFSLGILELNGGSRGMGPASSASGDNTQMAGGSD